LRRWTKVVGSWSGMTAKGLKTEDRKLPNVPQGARRLAIPSYEICTPSARSSTRTVTGAYDRHPEHALPFFHDERISNDQANDSGCGDALSPCEQSSSDRTRQIASDRSRLGRVVWRPSSSAAVVARCVDCRSSAAFGGPIDALMAAASTSNGFEGSP
jgi:hypothetical protein